MNTTSNAQNLSVEDMEIRPGSEIRLPKKGYYLHATEAKKAQSNKSGNNYIQVELEIVAPSYIVRDGFKYAIAGLSTSLFLMLDGKSAPSTTTFFRTMGLEQPSNDNGWQIDTLKGMLFYAIFYGVEAPETETDDEGKQVPILDPMTHLPITKNVIKLFPNNIVRPATKDELESQGYSIAF